jgi:hypothetical protein
VHSSQSVSQLCRGHTRAHHTSFSPYARGTLASDHAMRKKSSQRRARAPSLPRIAVNPSGSWVGGIRLLQVLDTAL